MGVMAVAFLSFVRPFPLLGLTTKRRAGWTAGIGYVIVIVTVGSTVGPAVRETVSEETRNLLFGPFVFAIFGAFIAACSALFLPCLHSLLRGNGHCIIGLSVGLMPIFGNFVGPPPPTPEELKALAAQAERKRRR